MIIQDRACRRGGSRLEVRAVQRVLLAQMARARGGAVAQADLAGLFQVLQGIGVLRATIIP